ncbi:DUF4834 family protein [Aureispira]|nr:DUF4834 family protein [Aureispira sp.]
MTTLILILFGYLFFQLLFKPAFQSSLSPNSSDRRSKLMEQFQQMHRQQQAEQSQHRNNNTTKKDNHSSERKGYKGGEYIDFEEL